MRHSILVSSACYFVLDLLVLFYIFSNTLVGCDKAEKWVIFTNKEINFIWSRKDGRNPRLFSHIYGSGFMAMICDKIEFLSFFGCTLHTTAIARYIGNISECRDCYL